MTDDKCVRWVWPNEIWHKAMAYVHLFLEFLIPLSIILFCYSGILWMLSVRINRSKLSENDQEGQKSRNYKFEEARKNTLVTLLIVSCVYVICWIQNQILYFLYNIGYPIDTNSTYFNFTVWMILINSTVNPFIYLIKHKDYQRALKEFISCKQKRGMTTEGSVYSVSIENTTESEIQPAAIESEREKTKSLSEN